MGSDGVRRLQIIHNTPILKVRKKQEFQCLHTVRQTEATRENKNPRQCVTVIPIFYISPYHCVYMNSNCLTNVHLKERICVTVTSGLLAMETEERVCGH